MTDSSNDVAISILADSFKKGLFEIRYRNRGKCRKKPSCFLFRSRGNGMILILGMYIIIFLIAYSILVISVFKFEKKEENERFYVNYEFIDNSNKIINSNLSRMDKIFSSSYFKNFVWPYKTFKRSFNCSVLSKIKKFTYLTSGWTKSVFSFNYNNETFALKTVNINGRDIKNCLELGSLKNCYEKASLKMYKEYILSGELTHSNIVQVKGWCVGDGDSLENIAVITELCSPVDTVSLLQMTFRQRLEVIFDVSKLLAYLATSPLGSVAINDFRRQQFVLCGSTLKLTDLDDLSIEEPECQRNQDCSQEELLKDLKLNRSYMGNEVVGCVNRACIGYNEKQNVINLYRHFVSLFLPINVPDVVRQDVKLLLSAYLTSNWSSKIVLKQAELLYKKINDINLKNY